MLLSIDYRQDFLGPALQAQAELHVYDIPASNIRWCTHNINIIFLTKISLIRKLECKHNLNCNVTTVAEKGQTALTVILV